MPAFSWRGCGPVGDTIFAGEAASAREIGEIGDDYDWNLLIVSPPPYQHALAIVEIDVDEVGVVHGECGDASAGFHQSRNVVKNPLPPIILQPAEVNWIHLFSAILANVSLAVKTIVLIGEFLTGENHGD